MFIGWLIITLVGLVVYSYGFVDLNLTLSTSRAYTILQSPLSSLIFDHMAYAGVLYVLFIASLWTIYLVVLRAKEKELQRIIPLKLNHFFLLIAFVLLISFPAFTYDLFNYMTTARVLYTHKENPYIVMPVEIPNEPALAYTRAANKVALYGPTWIAITGIPHMLGQEDVWLTIILFKAVIICFYLYLLYLIYKITGSKLQVLFFGLNPLVIIEVLVSSHNDVVMMAFALSSLALVTKTKSGNRVIAFLVWLLSVGVKGATLVLLPILFTRNIQPHTVYRIGYWLMFGVFLLTPFREELYPWYAVWFLSVAALLPMSKRSFVHGFSLSLALGLSLRHVPYLLTREYGGMGPILRISVTLMPVLVYMFWYFRIYGFRKAFTSAFYGI